MNWSAESRKTCLELAFPSSRISHKSDGKTSWDSASEDVSVLTAASGRSISRKVLQFA